MALNQTIAINPLAAPKPGQVAQFSPQDKTVSPGDIVFWQNNDEDSAHQPKPTNGADDDWVPLIPTKANGVASTSQQVSFSQRTKQDPDDPKKQIPIPYTMTYVCAIHPDETGTINVTAN
jgi:plastocyanin